MSWERVSTVSSYLPKAIRMEEETVARARPSDERETPRYCRGMEEVGWRSDGKGEEERMGEEGRGSDDEL